MSSASASLVGAGSFVSGARMRTGNVRGFGATSRSHAVIPVVAFLGDKPRRSDHHNRLAPRVPDPPDAVEDAARSSRLAASRRVALDLWDKAQRAKVAAKSMSTYAAFSVNGAAFAQLQTNAHVSKLWRDAGELEHAALRAWEEADAGEGAE
jgi:hypothetical protein